MACLIYILAFVITVEQAFDCISTNLVIFKGRGHEGNGLMARWMGIAGQWWWTIKLPVVAYVWYLAVAVGPGWIKVSMSALPAGYISVPFTVVALLVVASVYGYVLRNNYKIAWRK